MICILPFDGIRGSEGIFLLNVYLYAGSSDNGNFICGFGF